MANEIQDRFAINVCRDPEASCGGTDLYRVFRVRFPQANQHSAEIEGCYSNPLPEDLARVVADQMGREYDLPILG
jgi:hypothetical protein